MQTVKMALRGGVVLVGGAVLALTSSAYAGLDGKPLVISATNSEGISAQWSVNATDGVWDDAGNWFYTGSQTTRQMVSTTGVLVAELDLSEFSISYIADPQVNLNFGVVAGALNTNFTITSALLSFAPIANATATASAGITLVDRNNNGAFVTGLQPAGHAYSAFYNAPGVLPATGTTYTDLVTSFGFPGPGGSLTNSGNDGPDILPLVSNMSSQWSFTLSAGDSARGTSTYVIVPTPGTLALVGLAGLTATRRRR